MIYTVTLNPSVDYYMKTDKTVFNDVNRISEYHFVAAGKGINCSKILDVLSIPSYAVYFSGGRTGDFINQELKDYSFLKALPVEINGLTRVNVKIYGSVDNAFNPLGPVINEEAKEELKDLLAKKIQKDDVIIISGSLPRGCDIEYLKSLCRIVNDAKAKAVIDVPGLRLEDYRLMNVRLIKPNTDELKYMIGNEISEDDYEKYLDTILNEGVESVLLSLGSQGAIYKDKQKEYKVSIPSVEVIKSIGAGDAMLGTFAGILVQTGDIEQSLRMAAAAAVATVSCEGIPDREMIHDLAEKIMITEVRGER